MNFDFIKIHKSILDYSEYVRSVLLLKNYLKHRFIEVLLDEGFKLESEKAADYSQSELVFYMAERDLEVKVCVSKRGKEEFT